MINNSDSTTMITARIPFRERIQRLLPAPDRWHRPLLLLTGLMLITALAMLIMVAVDPQVITGRNGWIKPFKFAVSLAIYAPTLAWLIGQVRRWRRLADIAGVIAVIGLLVEMVIIIGAAAVGTTSHFNVSTPLSAALWSVMGLSIVVVWMMTLLVGLGLFRRPDSDPARALAVRGGVVLAIVGMGLALLMTSPTAEQLNDFQGIAGAHAVGVPDGGPGLPLLGWSTTGGDLRIPHFVGMHAVQALPLTLIMIELLSGRFRRLLFPTVRLQLIMVATVTFTAALALLTVQALIGQSIVHPRGTILIAGVTIVAGAIASTLAVLRRATPQNP